MASIFLQLGLGFGSLLLLDADSLKLLVALAQRIEFGLRLQGRRREERGKEQRQA